MLLQALALALGLFVTIPAPIDNPSTDDVAVDSADSTSEATEQAIEQPNAETKREQTTRAMRPVRGVFDREVLRVANDMLDVLSMGQQQDFEINGREYLFRAEPHYHPPGHPTGPHGWHKGITVYEFL